MFKQRLIAVLMALTAFAAMPAPAAAKTATETAPAAAMTQADFQEAQAKALKWELSYLAVSALDAAETIYCIETIDGCTEANPLFGKRPSAGKIIALKAGLGLVTLSDV